MVWSGHSAGNISLFLYCTIFGTAFLVGSTIHLASLRGFQKDGKCDQSPSIIPNDQLILNKSSSQGHPSSLGSCDDLKGWTFLSTVGVVYGVLCLLFGILKLIQGSWTGCYDACCKKTVEESDNVARGKIFRPVGTTHSDWWTSRHQTNFGFWSACFKCLHFTLLHIFWLVALILPTFLAVSLCSSNGIHGHEGKLYWPAMSLFIISILSLFFVSISAFIMVFWTRNQQTVGMTPQTCSGQHYGGGGGVCEAGGGRYEPVELKDSISKKPAASA